MCPCHYLCVTTARVYIPTLIRFDAFNFIHSSLLTSANRMDLLVFHSKIWMFWHGFQTPSWRCVNIRKRRHWRLRLLSWRTAAVRFFVFWEFLSSYFFLFTHCCFHVGLNYEYTCIFIHISVTENKYSHNLQGLKLTLIPRGDFLLLLSKSWSKSDRHRSYFLSLKADIWLDWVAKFCS